MSHWDLGHLAAFLLLLLACGHILAALMERWRQPRVIGEILAGVIAGPALLGRLWTPPASMSSAIEIFSWAGLLLLMFFSGAESRALFRKNDQKAIWLLTVFGTGIPFVVALIASYGMDLSAVMGPAQDHIALVLVIGIAVAVTSIPVISRIFHDLGIMGTRFACLVLGVAVIEDIALWAVLAIATGLAGAASSSTQIASHVAITLAFFAAGLWLLPRFVKSVGTRYGTSILFPFALLLGYVSVAAFLDVNPVFAAFLAGFAIPKETPAAMTSSLKQVSFSVLIPVYFAIVGYKLQWHDGFSLKLLVGFLLVACLVKLAAVLLGARMAGFSSASSVNLAVAANARGGPGIVLASVAYAANIINPAFYTTLILVAILTSQAAGAWLERVLRLGKPLLEEEEDTLAEIPEATPKAA